MKTVTVNASKSYTIHIGSGLLGQLGGLAGEVIKPCRICIVSDSNVAPLYLEQAKTSLAASGFGPVFSFVFPAGEAQKNGQTYLELLNFLAENQLTRSDCIVALGGGVVGDLTGFAASTYLRGIPYIQVPTTLLAAVDSSVGGKTAIDLPAGKNLAGAFYQPALVVCDTDTLQSLPEDIFRDGCAEVIKYAILYSPELFSHLWEHAMSFHREEVIAQCVALKRDVVAEDEFDRGARQKLNLGHTIGHGVEAQSNFTVSHGTAVAIGMAIVSRAGCQLGICDCDTKDRILAILDKFALPTTSNFTAKSLYHSALSDKKRNGDTVNLIIPERIGFCRIENISVNNLKFFIEAGL